MKIVIVGPAYPLRGAFSQLNEILGTYLSRRHDVEIVSFRRLYPSLLFPGTSQVDPDAPPSKLRVAFLLDSVNPFTWWQAARYIRRRRPDLILFRHWLPLLAPCLGVVAFLVRFRSRTRVLCICDNVVPHERRPGDRLLTRFLLLFPHRYLVHSRAVESDLLCFKPRAHVGVVPHPVYEIFSTDLTKGEARQCLGIQGERVLLFFGFIRAYKGLSTLLEAMPLILRRMPATLLVVGEFYDRREAYEQTIARHGLGPHIRIVDRYIPNDEVAVYFAASDVVVLPYRSATQSGIVQIAYQLDKPVIATDVGGLAEVLEDGVTGYIVPPGQPDALADAVLRFYGENREAEFVSNVRSQRHRYSWEAFVEAVERAGEQTS